MSAHPPGSSACHSDQTSSTSFASKRVLSFQIQGPRSSCANSEATGMDVEAMGNKTVGAARIAKLLLATR